MLQLQIPAFCSPPSSQSRLCFSFLVQGFPFELTSALHHFCARASLGPSASRALPAIFSVNVCAANTEMRPVMRSPIPNRMAGSRERPQQCSMCRSAEHRLQGDRHLHTPPVGGERRGGLLEAPHLHQLLLGILSTSSSGWRS